MLLIGLILFVFLLILFWRVVIWFVGTIGAAKGLEEEYRKYTRFFGIFIAVATVLFFIGDEIYTNMQFKQLCKKEAGLKIYKTVDNVDGFLSLYRPAFIPDDIIYQFDFFEEIIGEFDIYDDENRSSYIKNGDSMLLKIDYDKYNVNRFTKNDVINNVNPKSRYIYIETFINSRDMIIIDRKDKSIIAKNISFGYSGGKFNQFLASFYGGGGIKSCGDNISRLDFVKQVFQPTVQ